MFDVATQVFGSESTNSQLSFAPRIIKKYEELLLVVPIENAIRSGFSTGKSTFENALQSSESSDFLKFNLRYLSIEEGYRYVRHGVGKP